MIKAGRRAGIAAQICAALLVTVPRLAAQAVAVAQVQGEVIDSSGLAIPNAKINVTQTETGASRTTVSDSTGHYSLPELPVGLYRPEVTAGSFKHYVQTGIELHVGSSVQQNVRMQVGSVSSTVEVHASAGMVETRDNAVSQVIDQRNIVDLPLNGRQAAQLILLSGAAVTAPDWHQELLQFDHGLDIELLKRIGCALPAQYGQHPAAS